MIVLDASEWGSFATRLIRRRRILARARRRCVGGLELPHLQALGLGNVLALGAARRARTRRGRGTLARALQGKDTTTGHWELTASHRDGHADVPTGSPTT